VALPVVVLVVGGIVLTSWAQTRPLIDAGQATSLALDKQAGPDHTGWTATSTTLDYSGDEPRSNLPGFRDLPKCWGTMVPVGGGYCLPYPMWHVHLVSPAAGGQSNATVVFVDARKSRVAMSFSEPGPSD
jgi:hypothetical protein